MYDITVSDDWTYSANIYCQKVTEIKSPDNLGLSYFDQISLNRFLYNSFNCVLNVPGIIQFRSLVELDEGKLEKLMRHIGGMLKDENI